MDARLLGAARALAAAGLLVAADQASKQAALAQVSAGERINVFFGIDVTLTRNTGVAFGALEGAGAVVATLIAATLALLLVYFVRNAGTPWLWLPVGLLIGGALGNLADRARDGSVIDFIDPVLWPAFNVADAAIVLGVVGLLYVAEGRREDHARDH